MAKAAQQAHPAHRDLLGRLGIETDSAVAACHDGRTWSAGGAMRPIRTPIDGAPLADVQEAETKDLDRVITAARDAFLAWRVVPAPKRGEVVRQWGQALRDQKDDLGRLVSIEMGKSLQEGLGEVQEMIDICDFAVGLSRQLYGKTMHSERPAHRMYEQWHPAGVVGVISAFNFPVAVYAWNAAIALVCGDAVVWKPSEKTPLTAIAVQRVLADVVANAGHPGIAGLVCGGRDIGEALVDDPRISIVSATGSCRMGRAVAGRVAARLGRSILELGGNNGILVAPSADLDLATRAIVFGAVGTAGQRCTSTRRIFAHRDIADQLLERLGKAYQQVTVGDPLAEDVLMGPLIDADAVQMFQAGVEEAKKQGGKIVHGGNTRPDLGDCYVEPTLVDCRHLPFPEFPLGQEETFAPILYVFACDDVDQAIEWHNGVRQGLSSAIFTTDLREAERFLSATGSDCGIANVNIGTSGAEIGGAFGGEKETGGGREAGSDSWKQYMRRQTCTINWGRELPLAQGIRFDV